MVYVIFVALCALDFSWGVSIGKQAADIVWKKRMDTVTQLLRDIHTMREREE